MSYTTIGAQVNLKTKPFKHFVLDDFVSSNVISLMLPFGGSPNQMWYKYNNPLEKKYATDLMTLIPEYQKKVIEELNSPKCLKWLEGIFDMHGLIPDPYLRGGGLHHIEPGGKLDIHADFNVHPILKLHRRINLILYMNRAWRKEYHGELELWNEDMSKCEAKIEPIAGRLVAFETSSTSWHGHPDPWAGKDARRSIAVYYYTVPDKDLVPHSTVFKARPQDDMSEEMQQLRANRSRGRIL